MSKFNRDEAIDEITAYEMDEIWYRRDDEQNREAYEWFFQDNLVRKSDADLKKELKQVRNDKKEDL